MSIVNGTRRISTIPRAKMPSTVTSIHVSPVLGTDTDTSADSVTSSSSRVLRVLLVPA